MRVDQKIFYCTLRNQLRKIFYASNASDFNDLTTLDTYPIVHIAIKYVAQLLSNVACCTSFLEFL